MKLDDTKYESAHTGNTVFSGTRWMTLSNGGRQVVQLIVAVILARLLAPRDFGLMAMALVIVNFIDIFKDLGTSASIVQQKEVSKDLLSNIFFLNIAFGIVVYVFVYFTAPVLSSLFDEPLLIRLLRVLGITFLVSSLFLVKRALLQREMLFHKLAKVELASVTVNGAVAILCALRGWGVWALVAGNITGYVSLTLFYWLTVRWRPHVSVRWSEIKKIYYFSINLTGSQIFNYFIFKADNIVIGKYLGANQLGFYNIAQRILMTPVMLMNQVYMRVLFPAFSHIQDDDGELRQKYLRACSGIAMISFPMMIGILIVARPFVDVVLGQKWVQAIPLIIILAPISMIQSITSTVGVIYLAKGRTDWLFLWQIGSGTLIVASFFIGLPWGVTGVATAYGLAILVLTYPAFIIPFRLINLRFVELITAVRTYAFASAIMAAIVSGFRLSLEYLGWAEHVVLSICVIVGVICYSFIILMANPPALRDFQKLLVPKIMIRQ